MGINCSSKEEPCPLTDPLQQIPTGLPTDINQTNGFKSRMSEAVIMTTEDHHLNAKSRVVKQLSASSLTLKSLFTHKTSTPPSATEDKDEEINNNEGLEQLWEECYDLSELVENTRDRVLRYHNEFVNTGNKGDENNKQIVDLTATLAQDLEKLPYKDVVYGLRSIVFSTTAPDDWSDAHSGFLKTIQAGAHDLSKTCSHSYDLFILSSKIENKQLFERSCRLWEDIYRIYSDIQAISKKFEVLLTGHNLESIVTNSDEENLLSILNLLLNVLRRKQLEGSSGGLLQRIEELRQVLREGSR